MPRRKSKKNDVSKYKGPFAILTFGEILSGIFTAIIIGMALYIFQTLELNAMTMIIILFICFIGIVVAKIIISAANMRIKVIK